MDKLLFEGEVEWLRFTRSNGHLLNLCSQFLLPGSDRIATRRQVLQLKIAVLVRHRKIRMLEHCDVSLHPRMHVALDWNRDLLTRKGLLKGHSVRLRHVPLPIIAGSWMDIMRGFVAIH